MNCIPASDISCIDKPDITVHCDVLLLSTGPRRRKPQGSQNDPQSTFYVIALDTRNLKKRRKAPLFRDNHQENY